MAGRQGGRSEELQVNPLVPERFGCGLKVPFEQLRHLRKNIRGRDRNPDTLDFGEAHIGSLVQVSSIDKIFDIGRGWPTFAACAIDHAAMDVLCGRATPTSMDICFEFGPDLDPEAWMECSSAFFASAAARNLEIGKCHSTFGPTTAVTISIRGTRYAEEPLLPDAGVILLTGKIGRLKQLYLDAIGWVPNEAEAALQAMHLRLHDFVRDSNNEIGWMTDVTGYGLAGSLIEAAEFLGVGIQVCATDVMIFGQADREPRPECMFGITSIPSEFNKITEWQAAAFVTRELCGPMLMFSSCEALDSLRQGASKYNVPLSVIGKYGKVLEGVSIQ
jgi:hypothetical protein